MSNFTLFPAKYKSETDGAMPVHIWTTKFRSALKISKLPEEEEVDVFKLLIEGEAANWQSEVEENNDTKNWNLDQCLVMVMEKSVELMEIKKSVHSLPSTPLIRKNLVKQVTKDSTLQEEGKEDLSKQIAELTESMKELALLNKQSIAKPDPSNMTCFNCGRKGHTATICRKPKHGLKSGYAENKIVKPHGIPEATELCVLEDDKNNSESLINAMSATSKRMRLDNLVNGDEGGSTEINHFTPNFNSKGYQSILNPEDTRTKKPRTTQPTSKKIKKNLRLHPGRNEF
ncbi:hypothetical protein AYI69_g6303 [Smittium culicis]|uniref:CCHC-type domain-containing protein n=1 Tax=Smittium culicis TaxID=133412 RepID=A0A1R1Y092_9FUNG|nr:hypothetical protein AYI69_g6303 [Smittium culicis]